MAGEGMTIVASPRGPAETIVRLERAITARGNRIFAKIDHAKAAADVGLSLRPTTVLVFGNPKVGTRLMEEAQTVALDLPLKMLVFEDATGKTRIATNVPTWIAERHGASEDGVVRTMTEAVAAIVDEAVGEQTDAGHE